MSCGPKVRVVSEERTVMVEFGRGPNHGPDEERHDADRKPRWAVQMGYVDFLGRGVKQQLNVHAQFLSDCNIAIKIKPDGTS